MTMPPANRDREQAKFEESIKGKTSVRVTVDDSTQLITLVDTSSSDFIYIGSALPSTAKSDAKWRVQRIDIRTSEIEILFAGSSEDFTHVWDNRTGLVYG